MPHLLGDRPIPILSDHSIRKCIDDGAIGIAPFQEDLLGATFYGLRPAVIRYVDLRNEGPVASDFDLSGSDYRLQPQEHVVVVLREKMRLAEGFVGTFFPSSFCVERGLILTAGRLDAHYDGPIVFGLFNASSRDILLTGKNQLARISFGWLGSNQIPGYGQEAGEYIDDIDEVRPKMAYDPGLDWYDDRDLGPADFEEGG